MVYFSAAFLTFAIYLLLQHNIIHVSSTIAGISIIIVIKERFNMIKNAIKNFIVRIFGYRYNKWVYQSAEILGLMIFGIGFSAVCGYLIKRPSLYKWLDYDSGIALGSGIAIVLIGIVLFFVSLKIDEIDNRVDKLEKKDD